MARKCTTGFHWSVHFMKEDLSIKIEITTDGIKTAGGAKVITLDALLKSLKKEGN